ncbi:MAG: MBL fold metallo-hydrolase [Patescibacteria group bacterium]|nr:MBL fold metallo-hydrolase [Patescibacteria group bacterium]MDD4611245.1 MBL fold metallo-hydrolase [Patescibacteria group bacterium]
MPEKKYKIIIAVSALAFVAIFCFFLWQAGNKNLEVDFLDVGQGDAILIKSPYGQNILIDGGPDSSVIKRLGENLPWWDRQIDLMVLTHPHDDHVTGLIDVLKRYKVKKIIYTGVVHTAPNYLAWLNLIREKNIPVSIIDHPQTIKLGENTKLDILYPLESLIGKGFKDLNDSSLVIKLVNGENKFLFTGDAGVAVEKNLIDLTQPSPSKGEGSLKVDVLKVGHHGSDTATSEEFLNALIPSSLPAQAGFPETGEGRLIAVIPVGKDNDFGHPSLRIIKKLERAGAKIIRTDEEGTIRLFSDGKIVKSK